MIVNKIGDRWVICNYNYICLLPVVDYLSEEWQIREHFKNKITDFCNHLEDAKTLVERQSHAFGQFIDAGLLKIIIDAVKVCMWEGLVEQRCEAFKDSDTDSVVIRVNEDFTVSVEAIFDGTAVPIIIPIPLDDLEFCEQDAVQNILQGMTPEVAKECRNKAKALREAVAYSPVPEMLSDCDITLLMDEGLRDLLR